MMSPSPKKDCEGNNADSRLDVTVLELIASRICHDLISPVGAVRNGLEFLEEVGLEAGEDALELISSSIQQAASKLQAFRLVYGAGGSDPSIKPEDVHKIFESLIEAEGKTKQQWDPFAPLGFDELPAGYCKILMGSLMLAHECLPKGGVISITAGESKGQTILTATGPDSAPRPRFDEALQLSLTVDELDPRLVHPYAISIIASHYGLSLRIEHSEPEKSILYIEYD